MLPVLPLVRAPERTRCHQVPEEEPRSAALLGNCSRRRWTSAGLCSDDISPKNSLDGLHKTKPGEAYIDQVMVSSDTRGLGVGTKLLEWAEALARERDAKVLSLEVLNGNPARRLYERFGMTEEQAGFCTRCCISPLFICCFASQHYGCSHWGSVLMTKNLQ